MPELDSLLDRCQQGDMTAFGDLFRRFSARAYRLAIAILVDEQEAEDATQEAFIRVFRRIRSYRREASFNTWFTTIVINVCRDRLRRQKLRRFVSLEWLGAQAAGRDSDVVEAVEKRWQKGTLWGMVNRLEDKYRLPIILVYHEGLSPAEAAQALGLTTRTLYTRLNRARLQLRQLLEQPSYQESEKVGDEIY